MWRAEVRLERWQPRFEIAHRRLLPAEQALQLVTTAEVGMGPIYRRLFVRPRSHLGNARRQPALGLVTTIGQRRSEAAVEEGSDQLGSQGGSQGYAYALTEEAAYLETDKDEKPEIVAGPPPDPAWFKCWFCRKSAQEVQRLYGAEYPVRDPNTFAVITLIFICNECVARFAERFARERGGASP
jgi:hypothetical protein